MKDFWKELLTYGSRPVGSQNHEKVSEYLYQEMKKFSQDIQKQEFLFEGWQYNGKEELEIVSPEERELNTFIFLGSGSGSFEGTVRKIGKNYVWNMYEWDLYAIFSTENEIVAYVSGRNEGGLLSQTLIEGNIELPHFIIGAEENAYLKSLLQESIEVKIRGMAKCTEISKMRGINLIVPFQFGEPDDENIIICAHYDSMYNTIGAYDNGAGTAVLMALAKKLAMKRIKKNIILLFTDAEECRLAGSKYFVEHMESEKVQYVLNIDGIGRGEELEIWCGKEKFVRNVQKQLSLYSETFCTVIKWPPPPGSDHAPFYEKGMNVCMLTFNDQDILHTDRDVYQKSILRNMERMEALVWHMINTL